MGPGYTPYIQVDALPSSPSPNEQIRAVTFYRDVNLNGGWDPGIDYYRGDPYAPGGRVNGIWSTRYAVQITIS